ncbi:hypothetical protein CU098_011925 [Rhizopus stolonifer]|uniref:Uncharacterized protein n=1 Tax=Rhizopus stolonifer TaxID=4846 RepID=A0A367KXD2_RHIST|nr:hypothetical protein CU098_011925 [Rhizopus stolonifer]
MQVSPLLTPLNFNTRKRSRSIEDYESNYLKKRLISCLSSIMHDMPPITPPTGNTTKIDDTDQFLLDDDDEEEQEEYPVNNSDKARINIININGSMLPVEQRPGESKCRIPLFVLNDQSDTPLDDPMDLD